MTDAPRDVASFLRSEMPVTLRRTSIFDTDLTSNDDLLLSLLSLLLLLLMQALLGTLLLRRTRHGLSTAAFSLSHYLHLSRDLRASRVPRTRFAALAVSLLLLSLLLEFLVLYLTSPTLRAVRNSTVSLSLVQPLLPPPPRQRCARDAATAPCAVLFLRRVRQRRTRVTTCVTTNHAAASFTRAAADAPPVQLEVVSDLHRYGAEHAVSLGGTRANYSAAAFYTLGDGRDRVLTDRAAPLGRAAFMRRAQRRVAEQLLRAYDAHTGDRRFPPRVLRGLRFAHAAGAGPEVQVLQMNRERRFVRVVSERFVTRVEVADVGADALLSEARVVLRGTIGVRVGGPDTKDLFLGSGTVLEAEAVVWYEPARMVNWLSLSVGVAAGVALLALLRREVASVGSADIAAELVRRLADKHVARGRVRVEGAEVEELVRGIAEGRRVPAGESWDMGR